MTAYYDVIRRVASAGGYCLEDIDAYWHRVAGDPQRVVKHIEKVPGCGCGFLDPGHIPNQKRKLITTQPGCGVPRARFVA